MHRGPSFERDRMPTRPSSCILELPQPAPREPLFESVFLGGFECSSHRLEDGRRLDLTASTRHDLFAEQDYARLRQLGIRAARDGISWVKVERAAQQYDFSAVLPLLRAAEHHCVQVVWDLMHFGWPDDIDVFSSAFPRRFGAYARALGAWWKNHTEMRPLFTPINEISFLAWAGGDVRCMNPFQAARGVELKAQLVLATIECIEALRDVLPGARFLQPEPAIHIVKHPDRPKTWRRVESDELLQYQTWDMLTGRVWPSLGGRPEYLDVIGVNFYPDNQFTPDGETVVRGDPRYKPLSRMLLEISERYARPMIISETGSEGESRAEWLRYVAEECRAAMAGGCELHAITLYPVVNHPGWVDGRHCHNGLWDFADDTGLRAVYEPLARELTRQSAELLAALTSMLQRAPRSF